MSEQWTQAAFRPAVQTLLGSMVVFLTVPTGIGPVAGGWIASRRTRNYREGTVASAVAGTLGVLPWATAAFLAMGSTIDSIGYQTGIAHVGVLPAASSTFGLWQEIGVSLVLLATVTAFAIAGGCIAGEADGGIRSDREKVPN